MSSGESCGRSIVSVILLILAGECKRHLVVSVVHPGPCVGTDIQAFIPCEDERDGVLHLLGSDFLAVDFQRSRAACPMPA